MLLVLEHNIRIFKRPSNCHWSIYTCILYQGINSLDILSKHSQKLKQFLSGSSCLQLVLMEFFFAENCLAERLKDGVWKFHESTTFMEILHLRTKICSFPCVISYDTLCKQLYISADPSSPQEFCASSFWGILVREVSYVTLPLPAVGTTRHYLQRNACIPPVAV